MGFATPEQGTTTGRILWCSPSQWSLDTFGHLGNTGLPRHQVAAGESAEVFPWFNPALSPEEAVRLAAPSEKISGATPRNGLADVAYVAAYEGGEVRMEFTAEGIPVALVGLGDDGFDFWVSQIDRASRKMFADEDLMNRPACNHQNPHFSAEPETDLPCWDGTGLWVGNCWTSLTDLTAKFEYPSCSF